MKNLFNSSRFQMALTEWKKKNHASDIAFASRIGVTRQAVHKYKTGTGITSDEHINAICQVLGVDKSSLLTEAPKTNDDFNKLFALAVKVISDYENLTDSLETLKRFLNHTKMDDTAAN